MEKNIGKNQALALPGSPLFNLLGGALFGVPVGFVLCLACTSVGTAICYFFFSVFGGPVVRWLFLEQVFLCFFFVCLACTSLGTAICYFFFSVFGGPVVKRLFVEHDADCFSPLKNLPRAKMRFAAWFSLGQCDDHFWCWSPRWLVHPNLSDVSAGEHVLNDLPPQ